MKLKVSSGKHIQPPDKIYRTAFSKKIISAGLGATNIMKFVAIVLKTRKGTKLCVSVIGCRETRKGMKICVSVIGCRETRKGMKICVSVIGCREEFQTEGDHKTSRVKGI